MQRSSAWHLGNSLAKKTTFFQKKTRKNNKGKEPSELWVKLQDKKSYWWMGVAACLGFFYKINMSFGTHLLASLPSAGKNTQKPRRKLTTLKTTNERQVSFQKAEIMLHRPLKVRCNIPIRRKGQKRSKSKIPNSSIKYHSEKLLRKLCKRQNSFTDQNLSSTRNK